MRLARLGMLVLNDLSEAGERVGSRSSIPDSDTPIESGRHDVLAIVGPLQPVDRLIVSLRRRPRMRHVIPISTRSRCVAESVYNAKRILLVELRNDPAGAPNVPYARLAVCVSAHEHMLVAWAPRSCTARDHRVRRAPGRPSPT